MASTTQDLTESQIDKLLREAEERLAAQSSAAVLAASSPFQGVVVEAAKIEASGALEAAAAPAKPKDTVTLRIVNVEKKKDKKGPDNAGPDWYGLQKTVLTPETKRDFQILRMRGVLDPKQHFRKDTRKDMIPTFSAFGTIVEGTAEGETARLTRKERRRTIAEEVLASQEGNKTFKKRYDKIQEKKRSGKKGFYKKLVAQRRRRP